MRRWLWCCWLLWLLGCAPPLPPLMELEPGLEDLALLSVGPKVLLPGTEIVLGGRGLPTPGDGGLSLLLGGVVKSARGEMRTFEVRLRAEYRSATEARVPASAELFAALGVTEGTLDGSARIVVDSAIDLAAHQSESLRVALQVAQTLTPRLTTVELGGAQKSTGKLHPNDWVVVRGDNLLLGGGEGDTKAVLTGCFLPEGAKEPCTKNGRIVTQVEVPVQPADRLDRTVGIFPFSPTIVGIVPGRFAGTVTLVNQQPGMQLKQRSEPVPMTVALVPPELSRITPDAVSLGQYVEMRGAGFVGGAADQATLVRLLGVYTLQGSPIQIPVDLEIVVKWVPRYPDGPLGRYVLDETDALGRALESRGGLREAFGSFVGTAQSTLRYGKQSVSSKAIPMRLVLLPPKQVVLVKFLPSYQESLRLFGLRVVDNAVRARVLDVARRDYAGVNIEFREVEPQAPPPEDFAYFAQVEIGGADPNGLGYLGYDNTPGRDLQNKRLYDRIGGVNAVTQNDGSPGYGGVFSEQLLGFSAHPGVVEKIKTPEADSALFDQIFDPLRTDVGGTPAQLREAAMLPALTSGSLCPAGRAAADRPRQVACAIFVLGNLIGTTMTHELGHSLGLANPNRPMGSYHNNGTIPGRIMNPGGLRSFGERSELSPAGAAVFCDTDYEYLRKILPGPPVTMLRRPPCLD